MYLRICLDLGIMSRHDGYYFLHGQTQHLFLRVVWESPSSKIFYSLYIFNIYIVKYNRAITNSVDVFFIQ